MRADVSEKTVAISARPTHDQQRADGVAAHQCGPVMYARTPSAAMSAEPIEK